MNIIKFVLLSLVVLMQVNYLGLQSIINSPGLAGHIDQINQGLGPGRPWCRYATGHNKAITSHLFIYFGEKGHLQHKAIVSMLYNRFPSPPDQF